MPASHENRRSFRRSYERSPVLPADAAARRGGHRAAARVEAPQPVAAPAPVALTLISAARGVRLSRNR
jgi:hypothetical protein